MPGAVIASPLKITGQARGVWFFEGVFPVSLVASGGTILSKGFCAVKSDGVTKAFIPFEGVVRFMHDSKSDRGSLVLKKNNPTENSELDEAMEIPVFFQQ